MDSEDEDLEEELRAEAALLRAATSDSAVPHTTNTTQFAHERASGRQREADEDHGEEQRQQQSKGTAVLSSAAQRDPSTGRDMTATGSSAHMTHTDMSRAANRLENENNSEDEDDMDLDVAEDVALLQAAAYPHGGTFPTAHTHTMQTDADADEDEDDMELAQDIALLQAAAAPLQAAGAHSLGPHPAAVPATPVVTAAAAVSGAELLTSALQACGWPADAGLPCQAAALNRCYQDAIKAQLAAVHTRRELLQRELDALDRTGESANGPEAAAAAVAALPHAEPLPTTAHPAESAAASAASRRLQGPHASLPLALRVPEQAYFRETDGGAAPPETQRAQYFQRLAAHLHTLYRDTSWTEDDAARLRTAVREVRKAQLHSAITQEPRYAFVGRVAPHEMTAEQREARVELGRRLEALQRTRDETLLAFSPTELDWAAVARTVGRERTAGECRARWEHTEAPGVRMVPWSKQEDAALLRLVREHPGQRWDWYAQHLATGRTALQCLMRFQQSLSPALLRDRWTKAEDAQLRQAVARQGDCHWMAVARELPGRTPSQCMFRWQKAANPDIRKGRWTSQEKEQLLKAVELFGTEWSKVARMVPNRTDVQCREHYLNVLKPGLLDSIGRPWTKTEDAALLEAVRVHGFKWSKVAKVLTAQGFERTDNRCLRRYEQLRPVEFMEHLKRQRKEKRLRMSHFSSAYERHLARPDLTGTVAAMDPNLEVADADVTYRTDTVLRKRVAAAQAADAMRAIEASMAASGPGEQEEPTGGSGEGAEGEQAEGSGEQAGGND